MRSEFYKEFETAIKVRNTMIHSRYLWSGEGHLRLFVARGAESIGGALVDKETGAIVDKIKALSDLAGEAIQAFLLEGLTIKSTLSNMIKSVIKIVHQVERSA